VKWSKRGAIARGLTRVLIPTCIPELAVFSLVFPSIASALVLPFLIIPSMLGGFFLWEVYSTTRKSCSARLEKGNLFIKIPGIDILCMKPKRFDLERGTVLRVSSRIATLYLEFTDENESMKIVGMLKHQQSSSL